MNLYDRENKRLIIFEEKAIPEFWDKHWKVESLAKRIRMGQNNRLIRKFTSRFLNPGTKILEGGCGIGQNVYGLKHWGFKAYGVDFAQETVEKTKKEFPNLEISVQDVRKLNFPDNFFDGYWSLGVIEHFWDGYDEILKEMRRVIKPKGYLFLTFPYMSPLRRLKAKLQIYKIYKKDSKDSNFYEFILDKNQVKRRVENYGFRMRLKYPFDATKGLKDEVSLVKPILQKIYNNQDILSRGIRFSLSFLFSKIAGHSILLVFKKNENQNL